MELHEVERKIKELTLANWDLENSLNNVSNTVEGVLNNLQDLNRTMDEIKETVDRMNNR